LLICGRKEILMNLFKGITNHIPTEKNVTERFICNALSGEQENWSLE
jgi:hypothetical protein